MKKHHLFLRTGWRRKDFNWFTESNWTCSKQLSKARSFLSNTPKEEMGILNNTGRTNISWIITVNIITPKEQFVMCSQGKAARLHCLL